MNLATILFAWLLLVFALAYLYDAWHYKQERPDAIALETLERLWEESR